ncbi:KH domain-containing protein [Ditylenchus destructor]|uniref:KH domain-containing protein n=1 Tax=Ditylenchus destructor TaxID=166010 RepID=A0AAD4N3J0_9BILA|nr:KH domain-containing protein [Ditylenchus destructor]
MTTPKEKHVASADHVNMEANSPKNGTSQSKAIDVDQAVPSSKDSIGEMFKKRVALALGLDPTVVAASEKQNVVPRTNIPAEKQQSPKRFTFVQDSAKKNKSSKIIAKETSNKASISNDNAKVLTHNVSTPLPQNKFNMSDESTTPLINKIGRKRGNKKNSQSYIEELLREITCVDLAQSEYLFPYKLKHTHRLLNREITRARPEKRFTAKPTSSPLHRTVPSPGVRHSTVFPEEIISRRLNFVGFATGGYGDVPRKSKNAMPSRSIQFPTIRVSSMNLDSSISSPIIFPRNCTMTQKVYVPKHPTYNFIGRILGPRGNSVRRLEEITGCRILIRGKGSVKDTSRERKLRIMPGWEHLKDSLHVLITASDINEHVCNAKLHRASIFIERLLTPTFDNYKRQQLIQLAIIRGTYRQECE